MGKARMARGKLKGQKGTWEEKGIAVTSVVDWDAWQSMQCPSRLNEPSHADEASSGQQANLETNLLSALYLNSMSVPIPTEQSAQGGLHVFEEITLERA
eukprot:4044018-Amphidinium_carterae.2